MEVDYKFNNTWFKDLAKPIWDTFLPRINPTRILEIGSYEGAATCYLIDNIASKRNIELHCIDTWEGGIVHKEFNVAMDQIELNFLNNVKISIEKAPCKVNLVAHKGYSSLMLANLISTGKSNYFDFVYVDGSHQAPDVHFDALQGAFNV